MSASLGWTNIAFGRGDIGQMGLVQHFGAFVVEKGISPVCVRDCVSVALVRRLLFLTEWRSRGPIGASLEGWLWRPELS
jgi:hypothetical protein